ncbi:MAG: aspartate carbamoyltransferase catalytic subunit [Planctomycetes bacterium]|jgi:aspartate carbamoyltransferase catalytic subunit|nr:aspartate carbamoyltransferase catalytic subunit [Planctomycetota bacterium]
MVEPRTAGWTRRHLLGLEELTKEEILHILDTAESFKEVSTRSIKKVPALRGKVVVNLFFEPSTRTRTSFGLAATRLSADVVDFSKTGSSASKGETLKDTARNLQAMGVDIVVIRHEAPGTPLALSKILDASVVNAGDGPHEHPTQGLLDIFTMREAKGRIEGLKVLFVGDITHSRVARSNIWGLTKLGAEVAVVGPATLIPRSLTTLGVKIHYDLDEIIGEFDVINLLRIQFERQQANLFPSIREYTRLYAINGERLARAKEDVLIMHPGPVNRGVEITPDVADGPHSAILRQVTNGLAVRMAVLYLVNGAKGENP